MSDAHSPAPWEWDTGRYVLLDGAAQLIVRHDGVDPVSEADARLIQHAPEMLALLREVVDELGPTRSIGVKARALLARIDGGRE